MDTFIAGIELFGFEVKALRAHLGKLDGAHITVRGGEAYLIGASIPAFQPKNAPAGYEPTRNRRLLLNKKEIGELADVESRGGKGGNLTIIPISIYNVGRFIKIKIASARGRKKHDKREVIKRRDSARDVERELRDR